MKEELLKGGESRWNETQRLPIHLKEEVHTCLLDLHVWEVGKSIGAFVSVG
jgi:hypothetical protein